MAASSKHHGILEPIVITLGIGYRRSVSRAALEQAADTALAGLADQLNRPLHVHAIASHTRKAGEPALAELAQARGWPLRLFDSAQLAALAVVQPSVQVARLIGSPSVAEAAALLASAGGKLLLPRQVYPDANGAPGITVAIARCRQLKP